MDYEILVYEIIYQPVDRTHVETFVYKLTNLDEDLILEISTRGNQSIVPQGVDGRLDFINDRSDFMIYEEDYFQFPDIDEVILGAMINDNLEVSVQSEDDFVSRTFKSIDTHIVSKSMSSDYYDYEEIFSIEELRNYLINGMDIE